MKKIITFSSIASVILVVIFTGGIQSSCSHPNTNCVTTVTVNDTTGAPVSGAYVKLYANIKPPGQVQAAGTTNSSGVVTFTFSLPAIFDILANKVVSVNDTIQGT